MSNFVCPHCGMTNIDCGKCYKTPREIELEKVLKEIKEIAEKAIKGKYPIKNTGYTEGMYLIGLKILQKIKEVE